MGNELSCLVRSSRAGVGLHDLKGRCRARVGEGAEFRITADLRKGLYEMTLVTAPGTFPVESLMLDLKEWPTLDTVPAGPFDFDHTTYRMAVPTFRVSVDGRDCGLVWCEVPSPDDLHQRRIRALWGFAVDTHGIHHITLTVPDDEPRLRWSDIERVVLSNDDRRAVPLGETSRLWSVRPRLFTDSEQVRRLGEQRAPVQQAILDNLTRQLESGTDGTYAHRTVTAALVGQVINEPRWLDEAAQRTLALCARPYWGYHDVPEVMGWNNDRDTGMRLFETAVVYDWLYDRLTDAQRRTVRTKLAYHADLADRVTRLQKGYWYTRAHEAHGQGLWFGFACAALALLGDDPRADVWVEWIHGNMLDALAHMPDDGINEWPVFNSQWLILTAMLLERATGRRLRGRMPFLRHFAPNVGRLRRSGLMRVVREDKLPALLFYLARRHRDRRAQADALDEAALLATRPGQPTPDLDPLCLLAYDPCLCPSRPSRQAAALCSENGTVLCRGARDRVQFVFRCGTPLTARHHQSHVWIAHAWYRCPHAGSFSWHVGGHDMVPLAVPSYRVRTRDANLITIDGAGHRMDGRWLGSAVALEHMARIEHFAAGQGVTFCHANAAPAYTPECGLRQMTRRWVFLHEPGVVVMHDTVDTDAARRLAWHVHTGGRWQEVGPLGFATDVSGQRLAVRSLASDVAGTGLTAEVRPTCYVPPYSLGLNAYKTRDWQPEAHQRHRRPPDFEELTYSPAAPTCHWEPVTVMTADVELALAATRSDDDGTTVVSLGSAGAVQWCRTGPMRIDALGATVEAEMVVRPRPDGAARRWHLFGTRRIERHARTQTWDDPVDLVWDPNADTPRELPRPAPAPR